MPENIVLLATDENLLGPNWNLVMQVVDNISISPEQYVSFASSTNIPNSYLKTPNCSANAVYSALRKRMNSTNPKIVHLSLIVSNLLCLCRYWFLREHNIPIILFCCRFTMPA